MINNHMLFSYAVAVSVFFLRNFKRKKDELQHDINLINFKIQSRIKMVSRGSNSDTTV